MLHNNALDIASHKHIQTNLYTFYFSRKKQPPLFWSKKKKKNVFRRGVERCAVASMSSSFDLLICAEI